jgi:hypothetical protein
VGATTVRGPLIIMVGLNSHYMLIRIYYKLLGLKFGREFIILVSISIYDFGTLMPIYINGTLSENQIK